MDRYYVTKEPGYGQIVCGRRLIIRGRNGTPLKLQENVFFLQDKDSSDTFKTGTDNKRPSTFRKWLLKFDSHSIEELRSRVSNF